MSVRIYSDGGERSLQVIKLLELNRGSKKISYEVVSVDPEKPPLELIWLGFQGKFPLLVVTAENRSNSQLIALVEATLVP